MRLSLLPKLLFLMLFGVAGTLAAEDAGINNLLSHSLQAKEPGAAWDELEKSSYAPPSPASWESAPPTPEEKQKFYLPYVRAAADMAKDFYIKFPKDAHAAKARLLEFRLVILTIKMGATGQDARLAAAEKSILSDSSITGDDRAAVLWIAAQTSEPDQARPMLEEIIKTAPAGEIKDAAVELLKKMEKLGKPIDLQFTAVDGRSVDLAKLKGKVVLIDFWATWCPPCRGEVPDVKKTYDQYHGKGFEIVGISLDKDKESLTNFTAENKMEWPQFFDGQYWQNKYARQFGIESIPAMWLLDKKGNLRNVDAREDLAGNVQKLLAE